MDEPENACECGLDLSSVTAKSPEIQIKCFHDGSVGLSLHPEESFIMIHPGDSLEVRWRLTYPSDGGPPKLYKIGWDDEHRRAEADDRDRTLPGVGADPGTGASEDSFAAFTTEGAGSGLGIPDGFEPLVGYRAWVITQDGGLKSTAHDTVWSTDGPEVATCQQFRDGHHVSVDLFLLRQEIDRVPEEQRPAVLANIDRAIMDARRSPERNCMCGLYAVTDIKNLGSRISQSSGLVYGRVKAWGKIAEYTEGFRAEKAQIDALFLPKGLIKRYQVRRIAKKYGVPVEEAPSGVPSGVDRFFPATFHIFWGGFVLFSLLGNILGGFTGYLTSALMFTAAFLVSFALLRFRRKR